MQLSSIQFRLIFLSWVRMLNILVHSPIDLWCSGCCCPILHRRDGVTKNDNVKYYARDCCYHLRTQSAGSTDTLQLKCHCCFPQQNFAREGMCEIEQWWRNHEYHPGVIWERLDQCTLLRGSSRLRLCSASKIFSVRISRSVQSISLRFSYRYVVLSSLVSSSTCTWYMYTFCLSYFMRKMTEPVLFRMHHVIFALDASLYCNTCTTSNCCCP